MEWFSFGNIWTGSLRPDPQKGCLCQTTFNYKVHLLIRKKDVFLVAACWFELPWNCPSNVDEAVVARFEFSEFGLEVAENWITSKFYIQNKPSANETTRTVDFPAAAAARLSAGPGYGK